MNNNNNNHIRLCNDWRALVYRTIGFLVVDFLRLIYESEEEPDCGPKRQKPNYN